MSVPSDATCGGCRWYRELDEKYGLCRRRAPTAFADDFKSRWPMVWSREVCGEWELKFEAESNR